MKYNIGDIVEDDEGNSGHIVINWDEGPSPIEECAAHSGIVVVGKWPNVSPNQSLEPTRKDERLS